jgi:hypothetical protein
MVKTALPLMKTSNTIQQKIWRKFAKVVLENGGKELMAEIKSQI